MAKFYKSEAWMKYRWLIQRRSAEEMAKEAGCSAETIHYYLNKYGLKETRKK